MEGREVVDVLDARVRILGQALLEVSDGEGKGLGESSRIQLRCQRQPTAGAANDGWVISRAVASDKVGKAPKLSLNDESSLGPTLITGEEGRDDLQERRNGRMRLGVACW